MPQEEGLTDLALSKRPLAPEGKARPCGKTMDGGRRGGGLDPLLNSFGVVTPTEGVEESLTDWLAAATALPEKGLCFSLAPVWWKARSGH